MSKKLALIWAAAIWGCDGGPAAPVDAGGMDASRMDASVTDAGRDSALADGAVVCNPTDGIECDGDWSDNCVPTCAATECCSPQRAMASAAGSTGNFICVPRDAQGNCPAADIFVDGAQITNSYFVNWAYFQPDDCAIVEGCVAAPGARRLLFFDTWTPNIGGADMYLGSPTGPFASHFQYSSCHMHYHFQTYAAYELRGSDGTVMARGHKQAFCLEDFYAYPGQNMTGAFYDCQNQGIERNWQDVYGSYLDCQWVDVTDVPPGDYTLRVALNTAQILNESNYDNDTVDVTVTIPADSADTDVTQPCTAADFDGERRDCGWTRAGIYACNPGDQVRVGCSGMCGVGTCTGDTIVRVCDASHDPDCTSRFGIYHNDEAACGNDDCSLVSFTCPSTATPAPDGGTADGGDDAGSGDGGAPTPFRFVALSAPFVIGDTGAVCNLAVTVNGTPVPSSL